MAKYYRTKREKAQDKVQPMTALPQYADAIGTALELYGRLATLQESVTQPEAQIEQIVQNYPLDVITRRWMTVPYANPMYIAPLHVATHGKADQMETEQFKAALGAFPQVKSSGLTHQSRAHKKGFVPR